jgi:hypothetical protein
MHSLPRADKPGAEARGKSVTLAGGEIGIRARLVGEHPFPARFGTAKRATADWLTRESTESPLRATRPEAIWRWCFCQLPQPKSSPI